MTRAWEEFLFSKHQAVAVSPWEGRSNLQLLDILGKQGHSFHFPGSAPRITRIGNFFSLHKRAGNAEADALVDKIEAQAREPITTTPAVGSGRSEKLLIKREALCNLKQTVKASSKTFASVSEIANLEHSSSKELIVSVEGVALESVDRDCINDAIAKSSGPVWTPNMDTVSLWVGTPSILTGCVDMWIITDILYAEKFTVDAKTSSSAKLGASVPGALIGVPVPKVDAAVSNEGSAATVTELTGGNIPFAIRAMRLRYKSDGKLARVQGGQEFTYSACCAAPDEPEYEPPDDDDDDAISDPAFDPKENMGDLVSDFPDIADPDAEDDSPLPPDDDDAVSDPALNPKENMGHVERSYFPNVADPDADDDSPPPTRVRYLGPIYAILDPAFYPEESMGDLFSDFSGVADPDAANPEADEFVPLDIVVDDDATQAAQQSHEV